MRDYRQYVEARRESLSESAVAYDVSQALEECYAVSIAVLEVAAVVPVSAQQSWASLAAANALTEPCSGFEGHRIHPGEVLALLRFAAERGERRAQARLLLMRDVAASKQAAFADLPFLLASLDAGVVRDVGAFLARGETEVRLGGEEVPAAVAAIAWELAACDLGFACGPGSRITLAQCAFAGVCAVGSYEEALERAEDGDDMRLARALRVGIVSALRKQDWRWLGLE